MRRTARREPKEPLWELVRALSALTCYSLTLSTHRQEEERVLPSLSPLRHASLPSADLSTASYLSLKRTNRAEKKKPKKKGKKAATVVQTEPPTIPVSKFFKSGNYPEGETHEYLNEYVHHIPSSLHQHRTRPRFSFFLFRSSSSPPRILSTDRCSYSNSFRTTSEEKRHLERLAMSEPSTSAFNYNSIRRAAEVHRQVRKYARKAIKPGMTMTEIAEVIENGTRALVEEEGLERGVGFPTGLSRNHCAAHYTPNAGDTTGASYFSPFFATRAD